MNTVNLESCTTGGQIEFEAQLEPKTIAIATSTSYPTYGEGDPDSPDNIRGILAENFLKIAKQQGFYVVVVDGGSSDAWKSKLRKLEDENIIVEEQKEKGLSASRRQAMKTAAAIFGVLVVWQTEPEKIDIAKQIKKLSLPILQNDTLLVVPNRGEKWMKNYPEAQKRAENRGNRLANKMMRSRGLLKKNQDIDWWVGARFIKNEPQTISAFLRQRIMTGKSRLYKESNPGDWADAIFTPIIEILKRDSDRVKSVDIDYEHPTAQTKSELGKPEFERKRSKQLHSIITNLIEKLREIDKKAEKSSRLHEKTESIKMIHHLIAWLAL